MKKYNIETIWVGVLILVHLVGIVGLKCSSSRVFFESITAVNLLFSLGVILYFERSNWRTISTFFLIAFGIGMTVEIIGVNTGLLFGDYQYSNLLGLKLVAVPLLIGVNWFLLSFCSLGVVSTFTNTRLKGIVAASLMTLLDFLLEPFAISHGLWSWTGRSSPPFFNYICWFIFSLIICYFGLKFLKKYRSKIPAYYLLILSLFLIFDYILTLVNNFYRTLFEG